MEQDEYRVMYEAEDTHWWYVGLHDLVRRSLAAATGDTGGLRLLDAGCGTGGVLEMIGIPGAVGLDYDHSALGFCRTRGLNRLVRGSVTAMPFPGGRFDIVVSLDVLYHAGVEDDAAGVAEFNRVLAESGILILNLPAFEFLRSSHDEAIHTRRRYTKIRLKKLLESAGFEIKILCYRNSILFPFAAVTRLMSKLLSSPSSAPQSDLKQVNPLVNGLLKKILLWENGLLLNGFSLPWGLSLFAVARKAER